MYKRSLVAIPIRHYSRYQSVLINRLRIGHTRLTNSYLLKGENQPLTVHFTFWQLY